MNITDLYSTRIQKTYDDDHAEIVAILKANLKKKIKLINYYKGLPVSYPATIAAMDRGNLDLDVQAEQAFVMEPSRSVFIRSPLFKHDLFAQVQYVNFKKGVATLVKFSYVEIMAERRNFIRMAPETHPRTIIKSSQETIEGQLDDISLAGLNITIQDSCQLEPGSEVSASFTLATIDLNYMEKIAMPATLVSVHGDALPRNYCFTITPDRALERQLSQYIIQRQIEIIREIKDAVG
jgi:hypothetical protein